MMRLYMDENVRGPITQQLARRGVDLVRAQDDIAPGTPDNEVLARASELGRVLYSEDDDLLAQAVRCQRENQFFSGVIYGHQTRTNIGQIVGDLEFLLTAGEAEDFNGQIFYLPLQ